MARTITTLVAVPFERPAPPPPPPNQNTDHQTSTIPQVDKPLPKYLVWGNFQSGNVWQFVYYYGANGKVTKESVAPSFFDDYIRGVRIPKGYPGKPGVDYVLP